MTPLILLEKLVHDTENRWHLDFNNAIIHAVGFMILGKIMSWLALFILSVVFLSGGDCTSKKYPRYNENQIKCKHDNESKCSVDYTDKCVWNLDRCQAGFKEFAPTIPAELGKVKAIAVGQGFCAIDMNDELWCVPNMSINASILPHPSQKYRHVAMAHSSVRDEICATKLDGSSVCFNNKGKEQPGPTKSKVMETIPASFKSTVCSFSSTNIYCESDDKAFEKLDAFSSNKNVFDLAKNNPADPKPEIVNIGFWGKDFSINTKKIFVLFNSKNLLVGERDDTKTELWSMAKFTGGAPAIYNNVNSFSTYEEVFCRVAAGVKGVFCQGGNHHQLIDIPDDIKNADLISVSTSENHACVIVDGTRELKCWGAKKLTKNIPINVLGVKQVAVSNYLTCYIDQEDKLHCFASER